MSGENSREITIIGRDGDDKQVITWADGQSLMEAIRDRDLPILAERGGSAACATCHVHLSPEAYEYFAPPQPHETELLEDDERYEPGVSRLSCQLDFDPGCPELRAQIAAPPLDY